MALAFGAILYFGLTHTSLLYLLPLPVVGFVILVRIHSGLFSRKENLENLVKINNIEIRLLKGSLSELDNGSDFIDVHHPYSHDLDIFGDGSLFQYLNRCNTRGGKQLMASWLSCPPQTVNAIKARQEAIRELSAQTDFRQRVQAAGMAIEELPDDKAQLLSWVKQSASIYGKPFYAIILNLVPILTIASIVAAFTSSGFGTIALLMAAFQWAFLSFHLKRVNVFHDYISKKKNILSRYASLLRQLEGQHFSSPLMKNLSEKARDADRKVDQLANLVSAFDARLNSMTMLVVNSILLYDLQCVYRLEKWKEDNAGDFEKWFDVANETEVLSSFGTYAFNNPSYCHASIHDNLSVRATEMGHPLIAKEECVLNDVELGNEFRVMIVTGANMAGKSTFLRTLGINLVLALNGAPVFAKEFHCPLIQLRTGMRTADSLRDHQSYFYAELDRLSGIVQELRRDIPLLILLDEILKGTNSNDKQAGSIAVVKQLLNHPCLAVIATHDLALGGLENEHPSQVRNFCFEATIENEQLSFSYKLNRGMATRMNATFLMKKMGIIPD